MNAKQLHVAVSGVLQDKTLTFMSEFWDILDEAQRSSRGIVFFLLCSLNVWFKKKRKVRRNIGKNLRNCRIKDIK